MLSSVLFLSASFVSIASAQVADYQACGGVVGCPPTAEKCTEPWATCNSGSECRKVADVFWQCQPVSGNSSSVAVAVPQEKTRLEGVDPNQPSPTKPGMWSFSKTGGAGDATHYGRNGAGGTCSYGNTVGPMFAAFPKEIWGESKHCGSCVKITGPLGQVVARVVDQCPECKAGDIDLSEQAFAKIANLQAGRVHIEWKFVDCEPKNEGKLTYVWKEGTSASWLGIQVRDHVKPVESLSLNGKPINREFYNYFVASGMGKGPFDVLVTFNDGTAHLDKGVQLGRTTVGSTAVDEFPSFAPKQFSFSLFTLLFALLGAALF